LNLSHFSPTIILAQGKDLEDVTGRNLNRWIWMERRWIG
jgi:hypothetical protein